jgi:deoxyxylulose-5-phosphate synthase
MAQELIAIMQKAGVKFYDSNGSTHAGNIDFNHLIQIDTLISNPPRNISSILKLVEWFDRNLNLMSGLLNSNF